MITISYRCNYCGNTGIFIMTFHYKQPGSSPPSLLPHITGYAVYGSVLAWEAKLAILTKKIINHRYKVCPPPPPQCGWSDLVVDIDLWQIFLVSSPGEILIVSDDPGHLITSLYFINCPCGRLPALSPALTTLSGSSQSESHYCHHNPCF